MLKSNFITTESFQNTIIPIFGTWLLFLSALPFLESSQPSLVEFLIVGILSLAGISLGFLGISDCRTLPNKRKKADQIKLFTLSILIGIGIGALNLGSNYILSEMDPQIYDLLVERYLVRPDWASTYAAAIVEETVFRLFLIGVIAWAVSYVIKQKHQALIFAIIVSAIIFSFPHLWGRPSVADSELMAAIYSTFIVLISGFAGIAFGWIFWRWGLPYCIYSHFTANAFVLLIAPLFFT